MRKRKIYRKSEFVRMYYTMTMREMERILKLPRKRIRQLARGMGLGPKPRGKFALMDDEYFDRLFGKDCKEVDIYAKKDIAHGDSQDVDGGDESLGGEQGIGDPAGGSREDNEGVDEQEGI